jgi:hypothetical protein
MFNECRHILPSGYKCRAAALRGQAYCYFHTALRRYGESRNPRDKQEPLNFPSIEDTRGVQIALSQVIGALGSQSIDPNSARLYLSALRLAAQIADRPGNDPKKTVRTLVDNSGAPIDGSSCSENDETLAPDKTTCEPPSDCLECRQRNSCDNFRLYKVEVERLEQRLESGQEAKALATED